MIVLCSSCKLDYYCEDHSFWDKFCKYIIKVIHFEGKTYIFSYSLSCLENDLNNSFLLTESEIDTSDDDNGEIVTIPNPDDSDIDDKL